MTASRLTFRNIDADPSDPVQTWPIEAVQIALDRGTLTDWRRILGSVRDDPWGPVARNVEYVLAYDRPYGTAELFERAINRARADAELTEKAEVASQLNAAREQSGMTAREFAAQMGTSASRMSTYLAGKVTPSASMMVRAARIAAGQQRTAK